MGVRALPPSFTTCPRPSVCFVAHYAYGELAGVDTEHVGGIERQQVMMARWLAARGYRVHLVTWSYGQPDGERIENITVNTLCRRDAGIPGLRFIHPRWTSLCHALRRADADVYYYNCGDMGLGQTVLWCRRRGRRCVYSVASNPDCDPALPALQPLRERILYRYGLTHADRVIVQTRTQQDILRRGFGIQATVIPMPGDGPSEAEYVRRTSPPSDSPRILWVGRFSPEKRLEWLLDMAERLPQFQFDVIGEANAASDYGTALARRATKLANVALHGRLPRERVLTFYPGAMCLCCTSSYEGFPNTYLESWSRGTPLVSTFDPDGLIGRQELGLFADNVDALAGAVRQLAADQALWRRISDNGRRYYLANHTMDVAMARFVRIFDDVGKGAAEPSPDSAGIESTLGVTSPP